MRALQQLMGRYQTALRTVKVFLDMGLGWLLPLLLVLLTLSILLSVLAHFGPLAPFIYPLL